MIYVFDMEHGQRISVTIGFNGVPTVKEDMPPKIPSARLPDPDLKCEARARVREWANAFAEMLASEKS